MAYTPGARSGAESEGGEREFLEGKVVRLGIRRRGRGFLRRRKEIAGESVLWDKGVEV